MSRIRSHVAGWTIGLWLAMGPVIASGGPPAETLFPDTTTGFVAVTDVQQLVKHWKKTQLGQLMADPVMKPFADDLKHQFEDRWARVRERLGLTLDDLRGVPAGELAVGLVLPEPEKPVLAIVMEVTDNIPKATEFLEKVSATLLKLGAERSMVDVPESDRPVVRFDIPAREDDPLSEPGQAFYFLTDNMLGVSNDLGVLRGILGRLNDQPSATLADVPAFDHIMQRCAQDTDEKVSQIRWFIHPLNYVAAIRAAVPKEKRRKGKSVLEVLQNQGIGAVQGVGGYVDLAAGGYELIHRTVVHAPPPYQKAMKMLVFPNTTEHTPQRWVPRDVATYATFYFDILNAFDNFGPLFDELVGGAMFRFTADVKCQVDLQQGKMPEEFAEQFKKLRIPLVEAVEITTKRAGRTWEIRNQDEIYVVRKRDNLLRVYEEQSGIWEEVLQSLKDEGPEIDLREDLIRHLGQRITVITDYLLPITPTSERLLFAIETTNDKAVQKGINRIWENEAGAKRRELEGHIIWEMVEEEKGPELPEFDVGGVPDLTADEEPLEEEDEGDESNRLLPHLAITVAHGHLFIASDYDFLEKILQPAEERETLGRAIDYRLIDNAIQKLNLEEICLRSFSRTDEEYRPTYELIRQGKMPVSETMMGRLLNAMFGEGKKGEVRRQKIDGSELPDFGVVRRYLGPATMTVTSESTGWFLKGFTLSKEAQ